MAKSLLRATVTSLISLRGLTILDRRTPTCTPQLTLLVVRTTVGRIKTNIFIAERIAKPRSEGREDKMQHNVLAMLGRPRIR